ncbi:MAG TPA: 30S ribosomal protein S6 [Dehalococcoidia bacterium]|nr:30S ribosomal protein S6 [Dehalococcoidia bacterium]
MPTALRDYEMVVILSPEIGDDVISESLERLSQTVTSRGGEVVDVNHWGRRRLAYPIKRHIEGNYVVSQVKLDPETVPDLESNLRISEEVIRHMIVRAEEEQQQPPAEA